MDFSRALYGANSKIDCLFLKEALGGKRTQAFYRRENCLERINSPFALQDEWRPVVRRFPTRIVQ
jgi:hypothetical protein